MEDLYNINVLIFDKGVPTEMARFRNIYPCYSRERFQQPTERRRQQNWTSKCQHVDKIISPSKELQKKPSWAGGGRGPVVFKVLLLEKLRKTFPGSCNFPVAKQRRKNNNRTED